MPENSFSAFEIYVTGRVQGVAFRHFTREEAMSLSLNGTVQNLANGQVYIQVEGQKEEVELFLEWCHKGPSMAKVEKLEFSNIAARNFNSFSIIR